MQTCLHLWMFYVLAQKTMHNGFRPNTFYMHTFYGLNHSVLLPKGDNSGMCSVFFHSFGCCILLLPRHSIFLSVCHPDGFDVFCKIKPDPCFIEITVIIWVIWRLKNHHSVGLSACICWRQKKNVFFFNCVHAYH